MTSTVDLFTLSMSAAKSKSSWTNEISPLGVRIRRHPIIPAFTAQRLLRSSNDYARQAYRTARTELGELTPPHAVDAALKAYRTSR